jgi:dipeptidyl aminopeptidase/acylaminoacyl peptidase
MSSQGRGVNALLVFLRSFLFKARHSIQDSAWFLVMIATSVQLSAHGSGALSSGKLAEVRPVTVTDVIEMMKVADRAQSDLGGNIAQFSPDGKKFVVVLRKGNLERNTNDYSLLLWDARRLFTSIMLPEVLVKMSSSSNREGIADVKWSGNDALTFLGENPGEAAQVYAFNLRTHALRKLTDHPTSVSSYSMNTSGDKIAFIAETPTKTIWDEKARREGVLISHQSIPDLIAGRIGKGLDAQHDSDLFFQGPDGVKRMTVHGNLLGSTPFMSPDGRYIAVDAKVLASDIPATWEKYSGSFQELLSAENLQKIPEVTSKLGRYELVDTETGDSRILLDSPIWPPFTGGWPEAGVVWLPDSHSLVLSNVLLPLGNASGIEEKKREQRTFTVEINTADGRLTAIGEGAIRAVRWDTGKNRLICRTRPDLGPGWIEKLRREPQVFFALTTNGDRWQQTDGPFDDKTRFKISLKQGMNDPPRLYATDTITHQEKLLLDLNPQFEGLRLGKVEELQWQWSRGLWIKGGLYYPPDYVSGRRYPLVIQTHGWTPVRFWIDGPYTTAYAAQPLAAKGMLVVQVQDEYIPSPYGKTGQRDEVEKALAIYESVVDHLNGKGMIDRNRIGVIGFSHNCFYVKYALVHSKVRFTAATTTEGEDGGYLQFMTNYNHFVDAYSLYGGRPFGDELKEWTRIAPGFNVDKTHTPLRITTLQPENLLMDWEWFEALTLLGKPVDMVMMEDGTHALERPWQRDVSLQGSVDWFDFWLNGVERALPEAGETEQWLSEQYRRWEKLCDMQIAQNPNLPAFCVRSKTH